jgi:hypothetical protein
MAALGDLALKEQKRPQALWHATNKKNGTAHSILLALDELDDATLYQTTTSTKLPSPNFESDWLAQIPEEGQGISDICSFLISRSGRLRPVANAKGHTICLLPILGSPEEEQWSDQAPRLKSLAVVTRVFFSDHSKCYNRQS